MAYRVGRLSYKEALMLVKRSYSQAVSELGLNIQQAYAYMLDDVELLCDADIPAESIIVLTAVYKECFLNGLILDLDSPYTSDMVQELLTAYENYNESIFDGLNMSASEKEMLLHDMEEVLKKVKT